MTDTQNKIVIVGATSVIAEHCARLWAGQAAVHFILIGRNKEKLEAVASDLKVRSPHSQFDIRTPSFTDTAEIEAVATECSKHGDIDIVLIAQGVLPDQVRCRQNLQTEKDSLEINALSPVLFAEAFMNVMSPRRHGHIAVIGSVAGDRGRNSNYIYGAAKALLACYTEGLQHRALIEKSGIGVTLIKPGPTQTPMTAGLQDKGKLARPEQVAHDIVSGIGKNKSCIYTPGKWRLIMAIVRNIPMFLFKKADI